MELGKLLMFIVVFGSAYSKIIRSLDDAEAQNDEPEGKNDKVCRTPDCVALANEFLRGMNRSVDPCDNFYEFTCGGFPDQVPIPVYAATVSRTYQFQEVIYRRIKRILETNPEPTDILPVRQAKKWYRSCMNTKNLDGRGLRALESILIQNGGWPMALDYEEWDPEGETWKAVEEEYFHLSGSYIFYDFSFTGSGDITIGKIGLPMANELEKGLRDYASDNFNIYKDVIEGVAKLFIENNRGNVDSVQLRKDIDDLTEFEQKLDELDKFIPRSNHGWSFEDFIELYKVNVSDVKENAQIDFMDLANAKFEMVNYSANDSTTVWLDAFDYFVQLTKLLSMTPKRTIVNYIHWHFISSMLPYTTEDMRDLVFLLRKNALDIQERQPRWLECIHELGMTTAVSFAFVQEYYSEDVENDAREMIRHISDELQSQLQSSPWIDKETTELAIAKMAAMRAVIGFPDWFKNKTRVVNAYKGLAIGNEYFDNVLNFKKYNIKRNLRQLMRNSEDEESDPTADMDPIDVNAYYDPQNNIMLLPLANFVPPFFTSNCPLSVNYGAAGTTIGHEIGHGYDSSGIKYGPDGGETKISKHIMDMYYNRAECFLEQFNNYWGVKEADYEEITPANRKGSFGRRTRGENIADSVGLHIVYEAYRNLMKTKPEGDYKLPGFEDFTDEQLFFISYAATWCDASTPKYRAYVEKIDVHAPANLRVIGAASNTKDFARVFQCAKGKPMNPEKKCDIWNSPEPEEDATDNSH